MKPGDWISLLKEWFSNILTVCKPFCVEPAPTPTGTQWKVIPWMKDSAVVRSILSILPPATDADANIYGAGHPMGGV